MRDWGGQVRRSQVQDAARNSRLVSIAQGWFRSVVRDVVVSRVPLALQPTYFVGKLVMAEVEFRTMESRLATNHYQGRCVAAISLATYPPLIGQFQFSNCD